MMTLNDLKIGEKAIIKQLNNTGLLRLRLIDMGFIPDTPVTLKKIAPLGDPIQIQIRGYEITIRKEEAKKILVQKEINIQ